MIVRDRSSCRPRRSAAFAWPVAVGRIVDAAEVGQLVEAQLGMVAQRLRRAAIVRGGNLQRELAGAFRGLEPQNLPDRIAESLQPGLHRSRSRRAFIARSCWFA
jgi:hypothetical protein